jgi:hypothetical protein
VAEEESRGAQERTTTLASLEAEIEELQKLKREQAALFDKERVATQAKLVAAHNARTAADPATFRTADRDVRIVGAATAEMLAEIDEREAETEVLCAMKIHEKLAALGRLRAEQAAEASSAGEA